MSYEAFLLVMSQLVGNKKARVVVQDNVIFFEKSDKEDSLTLYTQVYLGEDSLPNSVRACVPSSGLLRWQCNGAYLKLDPLSHSVYLFEEIPMEDGKYIPFRHHLSRFSDAANEWKEILQEIADRDSASNQIS